MSGITRLALLAAVMLAQGAFGFCAPNLLVNPGFESGLSVGWTPTANLLRESLVQENSADWNHAQWYYHSGAEAAFVAVGGGNGEGWIAQRVSVTPDAEHLLRAGFRAADNVGSHTWGSTTDDQRAALTLREFDSAGNPVGDERRVYAAETMDWETLSLGIKTGLTTTSVEVGGYAHMVESFYATLGRALFDDFSLVSALGPDISIGAAKSKPVGQEVSLRAKAVTASFDGFFYIEEADRSAGMKVVGSATAGRMVDVIGVVVDDGGERAIAQACVVEGGEGSVPRPVGLSTRSACSPLPVGLLVACWGAVESVDPISNSFTISDGGPRSLKVYWSDGEAPLKGSHVRIAGALGAEMAAGGRVPVLRAVAVNVIKSVDFELPSILWATSTRPDGTIRFWDPAPVVSFGPNVLCVAYRPQRVDGGTWYGVGMIPPALLEETLANAQPELRVTHDHGIEVVGYADCILFYEDMLAHDGVDCSGLHALNADHSPVTCSSWGATAFVSCVNNPQWVDLQRQVMEVTARAGIDHLQLDIYPYAIAPGYCCHCAHCEEDWREVSRAKFGSPQAMPPSTLDFTDPAHRAYFEWRLANYTDFVKSLQSSVRLVNPRFEVIANQCTDTLDFVREALDGALNRPTTELWHLSMGDESSLYMYRLTERANGGRLTGVINDINQVKPGYRYRVCLAEAYAGGGNVYAAAPTGTDEIAQISRNYYEFIRANQEWYVGAQSQAAVGVLYSWRDHAYIQKSTQGPTVAYGQGTGNYRIAAAALARRGVSYDCVIVDQGLSQSLLSKYQVIVAPNLSLVDDADAEALEQYVRAGGCLLSTGALGRLKQAGDAFVSRSESLLTSWTHLQTSSFSWNAGLGDGRVSYVAQAYTGDSEATRATTSAYEAAAVYLGLRRQVCITAASAVETTVRSVDDRIAVHLVRLGSPDGLTDKSVCLDYELPVGAEVESVCVSSPDFAGPVSISSSVDAGKLRADIGRVDNYSLLRIKLRR